MIQISDILKGTNSNIFKTLLTSRNSYIGRRPILLDTTVQASIVPITDPNSATYKTTPFHQLITLKGPLGSLSFKIPLGLIAHVELHPELPDQKQLLIKKIEEGDSTWKNFTKWQRLFVKSMWGTSNSIISHQAIGVSEGHHVILRLVGVGFRAKLEGQLLFLKVGYSHLIQMTIPSGITASVPIPTKIILKGTDLLSLTQFAAKIRSKRKPEPYNGKGIFVNDETIIRKEGKKK